MLPYGRQSVDEADIEAVVEVLRGDWLTTGPTVARFEEELARAAGASRVVTCTSGTAALHTAYAAAGIGPGAEVITTPMTFAATATSALALGATIRFVDVTPDTLNLDPDALAATISDRTAVVAAVDYAGHPADMGPIAEVAHAHGALTVEDAAHSIGSSYRGRPVGSLADLTTFSFFPTKNMTTAEGGGVAVSDDALGQRAHEFHNIGLVRDRSRMRHPDEGPWHQEVHAYGLNYRLPDVLCALGLSQLSKLQQFKRRRQQIFDRYHEALADVDGISTPTMRADVEPTWHLYPVRILDGRRREVFERMRAAGIGVQVNYLPVHWHPVFEDLGHRRGQFPVAERFYAEELSLPMFPALTDDQVDQVVETLVKALA